MSSHKTRARTAWLALASGLVATLVLIGAAPQAQAAFSTAKCQGPDIVGQGASFARDAHQLFNSRFASPFCLGTGGAPDVAYIPTGSGSGRTAVTNRALVPRFGMSDDPLSTSQKALIQAGNTNGSTTPDTDTTNDGIIHQIPAAVGAVASLVNVPNNCNVNLLDSGAAGSGSAALTPEQDQTADGVPDGVQRLLFTRAQYEAVWAGDPGSAKWTDVFPALLADADCDVPIVRVVRFDSSGTTRTQKDYLHSIKGDRGWASTYRTDNRIWPNPDGSPSTISNNNGGGAGTAQCGTTAAPGPLPDSVDRLTSGCEAGNEFLIDKLKTTDGSIGYADLSTARNAGLAITPRTAVASPFDNDKYWTMVPNGSNVQTDPSVGTFGFREGGPKGSNCSSAVIQNVPTSTLGDWSTVTATNSTVGFGICAPTYGLLFDDNAPVWGSAGSGEEAKARTVKDYWENVLSDDAQSLLALQDYSPLPSGLLAISRAGVASIGWDKDNDVVVPPPPPPPPPPDPVDPTPPGGVSNVFSIGKRTIDSKKGSVTVQVRLPGAGTVELTGEGKVKGEKKPIDVGSTSLRASEAGTYDLTLKPSSKAKSALKKTGSLKVALTLTYEPTGGTPAEKTTSAKLKVKKKK